MQDDKVVLQETAAALQAEWGLQPADMVSVDAIIQMLAGKITDILQQGPDAFYQLMYRIDISEKKLNAVIGHEDTAQKIARLIYNRQLDKIQSRKINRQKNEHIDPDLEW